jgi:hypothetical protein
MSWIYFAGASAGFCPPRFGKQYAFRFAFRSDFAAPASSGGKTFIDPRLLLTAPTFVSFGIRWLARTIM